MNLDPQWRPGEDSPKSADGLRLGVLVGAGGGVVSAIALPLVVLIAGLVDISLVGCFGTSSAKLAERSLKNPLPEG